jgi:transposase-like protein
MAKQKTLTRKRQYHTKEFKLSAVKMVLEEHIEANEVAKRLGLNANDLKRWAKLEEKI